MFVILGGTGHVGFPTASFLLDAGAEVTIVTRDRSKAAPFLVRGANVAVTDVADTARVRDVFRKAKRAFLLNPPAAPDTDTDAVERESVRQILAALDGSGLEHVVALSTYGAQKGECIGDLNTLYDLETGLRSQPIPHSVIRAGYFYSNWDASLPEVTAGGDLPTMFPADLEVPMVAPQDLGRTAADLLLTGNSNPRVIYVEGPERYSARDVADAFSAAIGREVGLAVIERENWAAAFRKIGFSEAAAVSYARMTAITVDGHYDQPTEPLRGTITLQSYVAALVRESSP